MGTEWNNNGYDNNGEQDYAFQTVSRNGRPKTIGWSIASLITGVASVLTCMFGWSSLILGILAIVFAVISRRVLGYFDGKMIVGFILGIHGILLGITVIGFVLTMGEDDKKSLWEYVKQMFSEIEEGPGGSSF